MDLSGLTVQQLRYLVALERHRNFVDAAKASHVSQPALSAQVKKVESLLELPIFDRSRQPVMPTARGAEVVAQAKIVLHQIDRIGSIAQRRDELTGPYRLGVIPSLVSTLLPSFLPRFAHAHPRVELDVLELKTDELLRRLREGRLDGALAATPLDVPSLHERVLLHEALYVYLPPGHDLLEKARVRQSDLMGQHLWLLREGHCLRTQVLHLCNADRGRDEGSVRFEGDSLETLRRLVDEGFGVTVLPELTTRQLPAAARSRLRPFSAPEPIREVSFVVAREQVNAALDAVLFDELRASVPSELRGRRRAATLVRPLETAAKRRA